MSRRKTGQAPETSDANPTRELSYREERYVQEFLKCGNQTLAARKAGYSYTSARQQASDLMTKPYIRAAIDTAREEYAKRAQISREDLLEILIGMATATQADFVDVLKRPDNQDSYKGLGNKIFAIQGATKSAKFGNDIKLADRRAAVNDLWEKLGFDKDVSKRDRLALFDTLLGAARRKRGEGTPSTGDGGGA